VIAVAVSAGVLTDPAVKAKAVAVPLADKEPASTAVALSAGVVIAVAVNAGVLIELAVSEDAVAAPLADSQPD
jgi:hypothetical protein